MAGIEGASAPPYLPPPPDGLGGVTDQVSDMTVEDAPQGLQPPAPGATSPVMAMFQEGAVVVLQSVASRHALCVSGGDITGKGIRDAFSQFKVHRLPSGNVALQNVGNVDNWLTVYEGKTLGSGTGGPYAEFVLHEIEGKYVALESVFYPGQHVGIREDGELQPTAETAALDRASLFVPFPHFPSSSPGSWVEPSPQPGELPPPYPGPPTDGFGGAATTLPPVQPTPLPPYHAPGQPYPPQQPTMAPPSFQPHQPPPLGAASSLTDQPPLAHPPGHIIPTHPTIPLGYEVMDLFHKFNSLHLIPREDSHLTDHPVAVSQGLRDKHHKLKTGGSFNSPAAELLAETSPEGNIALRNPASQRALCCNGERKLFMGDDVAAYGSDHLFRVRSIHGAIVALESAKFPGHFVSVGKHGVLVLERQELKSHCVQFTVYVSRFKGPYSRVLTSPFSSGRPSPVSKLKDMSVIQLFSKSDHSYLGVGRKVQSTEYEEDDGTFLQFRDRGMGRVSLTSYFGKRALKIDHNGHLSTDSHGKDKYTDFYVRECPDGTLLFESVVFPQEVLHMTVGTKKNKETISQFSVYLLDRNRTQGVVGYKSIPKYAL